MQTPGQFFPHGQRRRFGQRVSAHCWNTFKRLESLGVTERLRLTQPVYAQPLLAGQNRVPLEAVTAFAILPVEVSVQAVRPRVVEGF